MNKKKELLRQYNYTVTALKDVVLCLDENRDYPVHMYGVYHPFLKKYIEQLSATVAEMEELSHKKSM